MNETERELALALYRLRRFEEAMLARHPVDEYPSDDELADHLTLCDEVQRLSIKRERENAATNQRLWDIAAYGAPPDPASED